MFFFTVFPKGTVENERKQRCARKRGERNYIMDYLKVRSD